jgi:hypothetical protein
LIPGSTGSSSAAGVSCTISLDFTTKDDVAAYVAAAAMDEATPPRFLRIAGDSVSAGEIAATMTAVTGDQYRTLWVGTIGMLGAMIRIVKIVSPQPALCQYRMRRIRGCMIGISWPSMSMNAPLRMDVTLIGARSAMLMNSRLRSRLPLSPGPVFVKSIE